ncbi:MAG: hypothetical protein ACKPER_19220, partial [Dolichospermum sp.]
LIFLDLVLLILGMKTILHIFKPLVETFHGKSNFYKLVLLGSLKAVDMWCHVIAKQIKKDTI